MHARTDYGHPIKPFFNRNPELLGLGRQFGQINLGAFKTGVIEKTQQFPLIWNVLRISYNW